MRKLTIELKDLSGDVWKDSVSIRVYQQKAIVAVGTPYWDIAGTYRSEHGQRERLRTRRSRDNSDLGIDTCKGTIVQVRRAERSSSTMNM